MPYSEEELRAAYEQSQGGGGYSEDELRASFEHGPEANWFDAIGSRMGEAVPAVARGAANLQIAAGENLPEWMGIDPRYGYDLRSKADEIIKNLEENNYVPPDTMKDYVSSGAGMLSKLAPAVATNTLLPQIALDSFGGRYEQLRGMETPEGDPALRPDGALVGAAGLGAFDTALANIPIKQLTKVSPIIAKMLGSVLGFEAMGAGSDAATIGAETAILGEPQKSTDELYDEFIKHRKRDAVHGLMAGGAFGMAEATHEKPYEPMRVGEESPIITTPEMREEQIGLPTPEQRLALPAPEAQALPEAPVEIAPVSPEPIAAPAPDAELGSYVSDFPIVEFPTEKLRLSPDVPNFKRNADDRGVVKRLEGKYDRRGTPPLSVWERLDGNHDVISGRHKFDLGQRTGEKTLPSQIFRESEGFTKEMAARLDAEINIRDEQGEVTDFAQYFRQSGISPAEAEERGLVSRAKGAAGYEIGTNGSEAVYALHQAGKLSDAKAAAIAKGAPRDETLQQLGISLAKSHPADFIYNRLQIQHLIQDASEPSTGGAIQEDAFGNDPIKLRADKTAALLETHSKMLRDGLKSIEGAASRPEAAKKGGAELPQVERTKQLVQHFKREIDQWDDWASIPEIRERVLAGDVPTDLEHIYAAHPGVDKNQTSLFEKQKQSVAETVRRPRDGERASLSDDERGSVVLPFREKFDDTLKNLSDEELQTRWNKYDAIYRRFKTYSDPQGNNKRIDPYSKHDVVKFLKKDSRSPGSSVGEEAKAAVEEFYRREYLAKAERLAEYFESQGDLESAAKHKQKAAALEKATGAQAALLESGELTLSEKNALIAEILAPRASERASLPDDETGAVKIPFAVYKFGERMRDVYDRMRPEAVMKDMDRQLEGFIGPVGSARDAGRDPSVAYYQGKVFDRHIPGMSQLVEAWRHNVYRPMARADKFPAARPIRDAMWEKMKEEHSRTFDRYDEGKAFFDLTDKTKTIQALDAAMQGAIQAKKNGTQFSVTPQSLQQAGLSPQEVNGFFAARTMLDRSWEVMADSAIKSKRFSDPKKQIEWENTVRKYFAENKQPFYVPRKREGDLFVFGERQGSEPFYSFHKTVADQARTAANLRKAGYDVKVDELLPEAEESFGGLPPDVRIGLKSLLEGKVNTKNGEFPVKGFKAHFIQAKNIEGYDKDLAKSIVNYVSSSSRYSTQLEYAPILEEALSKIDRQKQPQLYDDFARTVKYLDANTAEGQAIKSFFAHYFLGFLNVKSAVVNGLFQPLTTHYPELGKLTKQPLKNLFEATRMSRSYQRDPASFATRNKELYEGLRAAERNGTLSNDVARNLAGVRRGKAPNETTWSDVSMKLFTMAERNNHILGYISGYRAAPAKMTPLEKQNFAERYTKKVNFDYSKANRPPIARGWKAPFFTFRQFQLEYMGMLKDNLSERDYKAVARMIGPMIALGGVRSVPGIKEMIGALIAGGYDADKKIRDNVVPGVPDISKTLLNGIPQLFGLNVSGAIGVGELAPDIEQGPLASAMRLAGGVPVGFLQRFGKAAYNWDQTGEVSRTAEALLPESLRNAAVAARAYKDGGLRDPRGIMLPGSEDPTAFQLGAKALSFTPSKWADAYTEQNAIRHNAEAEEGYNAKIARDLQLGDGKRASALLKEMLEKGIRPNATAITQRRKEIISPDYKNFRGTPKDKRDELYDIMQTYRH